MSDEVITFCVPFHRGQRLLRESIRSVLQQTSHAWRLVVCDDAGPEVGTEDLVVGFGDPRIRYVRNARNLGLAGNFNKCLTLADTELVTLLHYDDRLLPDYVARMGAAAATHRDAVALHCGAEIIDRSGGRAFSLSHAVKRMVQPRGAGDLVLEGERAVRALMLGDFIVCPTTCYRRSRLPADPFDARWEMVLDLDLFVRLLMAGERLVVLRDVLYQYRRHPLSTSTTLTAGLMRFEEEAALHDEVAAAAQLRGWDDAARTAVGKRMIKSHLLVRIAQDCCHRRFAPARDKARFVRALAAS